MTKVKRVKKRKLNIKALIILLLIIYLIGILSYTILTMPIKNIYIKNTNLITDNEVIEIAGIKDYPPIFKIKTKDLENKISALELINNVTVTKKITGELTIEIDEAIPLFYNRNNSKVELSNGASVASSNKYLGIPTLINSVTTDLLTKFKNAFKEVDPDIIKMINEIKYDPDISDKIVIDNSRFLLRMNDTNQVYVNILNMKRLNKYKEIIMTIGDKRGTLFLDSYSDSNNLLGLFEEFKTADKKDKDNKDDKNKKDDNSNNNDSGDDSVNE